jgi:hypothetical protein
MSTSTTIKRHERLHGRAERILGVQGKTPGYTQEQYLGALEQAAAEEPEAAVAERSSSTTLDAELHRRRMLDRQAQGVLARAGKLGQCTADEYAAAIRQASSELGFEPGRAV